MIAFLAYGRRGRRFAVLGALGCLLLLAACGDVSEPRGPATADTGPNVLIYVVDTLRRDGLGVHAGAAGVSPRIDAIAREGVVFEDATAASSWTRASIATLLTGVSPPAHGAVDRRAALPHDVPTLAEQLAAHGYATGFVTSNPNVGSFFGFGRGFDTLLELYGRREPGYVGVDELVTRSDDVTRAALGWLDGAATPWLLVVLAVDPHSPYVPPAAYDRFVPADAARDVDGSPASLQRHDLSPPQRARIRSLYDAEIAFTDASFGALVDGLKQRGTWDDTLVVITSDHGEEFWERGVRGHGASLAEAAIRIPLIVRLPRSAHNGHPALAGTRRRDPVGLVDVAPTVLDVLGLPADDALEGRTLLSSSSAPQAAFASLSLGDHRLATAREPRWKLVWNLANDERALYDLASDPLETSPIEPASSAEAASAAARLTRVVAEHVARRRPTEHRDHALPADVEATLRALGYLDGTP